MNIFPQLVLAVSGRLDYGQIEHLYLPWALCPAALLPELQPAPYCLSLLDKLINPGVSV